MRTPHRRTKQSVIERLLDEPQRFEFFQAVRLAVDWLGEHGVPRGRALAEYLRFSNSLSLGFPPSEVEALQAEAGGRKADYHALDNAAREQQELRIRITPSFMGFLGAHGTLPVHYTERINAWQATEQDEAPRAFLDMLSNRMLALFYEAWRKHRIEQLVGQGNDAFLPLLLALSGFDRGVESEAGEVRDEAFAFYAGLLQQRPVSSVTLGLVLSGYLGVPVKVQEAIGHWNPMAPHEQCCLGVANARLGEDTMLGANSWRPDLRARVSLGPLSKARFDSLLPNGAGASALRKLLCLLGEPTLVYEVELVLRSSEVRPVCLVGGAEPEARLGLDSFMLNGPVQANRSDMRYDVRPMAPLPPRGAPGMVDPSSDTFDLERIKT
jgi:type VI secretion system protein ImpH